MSNPATTQVSHPVPGLELFQFVYDDAGHIFSATNTDKKGVERSVSFDRYPKQNTVYFKENGKPTLEMGIFYTGNSFKIVSTVGEKGDYYTVVVAGPNDPAQPLYLVNQQYPYASANALVTAMSQEIFDFAVNNFTADLGSFSIFTDVFTKASQLINPTGLNPLFVESNDDSGSIPNGTIWSILGFASAVAAAQDSAPFIQEAVLYFCGTGVSDAFTNFKTSPAFITGRNTASDKGARYGGIEIFNPDSNFGLNG